MPSHTVELGQTSSNNLAEGDESTSVIERVQAGKNRHLNMSYILSLLKLAKRERTKAQIKTLVRYLKTMKVFRDLLLRDEQKEG